jgi:hypothetical protein
MAGRDLGNINPALYPIANKPEPVLPTSST